MHVIQKRVWDNDIDKQVLGNPEVMSINGMHVHKSKDLILGQLMKLKLRMSSTDYIALIYGDDGKAKMIIVNQPD